MLDREFSLGPDLSEIPRFLDWVEEACAAERVSSEIAFKMMLALEEAVTNVIRYAFADTPPPHRIRVRLRTGRARLLAEVIDNGGTFDPWQKAAPDPCLPLAARDPGGLGIHLMRSVMDRVEYRREEGQNRLLLEKRLAAQGR